MLWWGIFALKTWCFRNRHNTTKISKVLNKTQQIGKTLRRYSKIKIFREKNAFLEDYLDQGYKIFFKCVNLKTSARALSPQKIDLKFSHLLQILNNVKFNNVIIKNLNNETFSGPSELLRFSEVGWNIQKWH